MWIMTIDGSREFYMSYDLLVGCDVVRSVVREAMIKRHPTFEMDIGDIFNTFKVRVPSININILAIVVVAMKKQQCIAHSLPLFICLFLI